MAVRVTGTEGVPTNGVNRSDAIVLRDYISSLIRALRALVICSANTHQRYTRISVR